MRSRRTTSYRVKDRWTIVAAVLWFAVLAGLLALGGGCVEVRPRPDGDDVTPSPGKAALVIIEEMDDRSTLTSEQREVILQSEKMLSFLDGKFPDAWRQWDDDLVESQFANESEEFKNLYFPKPAKTPWVRAIKGKKTYDGPLESMDSLELAAKKIGVK